MEEPSTPFVLASSCAVGGGWCPSHLRDSSLDGSAYGMQCIRQCECHTNNVTCDVSGVEESTSTSIA